jgi:hypothetical protein
MPRISLPLTSVGAALLLAGCQADGAITGYSPAAIQFASAPKLKVDQSNPVSDPEGLGFCNGLWGQTFVPQEKNLARVDLLITVNQLEAGEATTVGLYTDITQAPIATSSVTIDPHQPGELSRVVSYTFATPVPVQKGTTYTIGWQGALSCWQFSRGDPYPRGTLAFADGSLGTGDFYFITYSSK